MPIIKPQVLNQNPFVASFDAVSSIACRCQQSSSGEGCVTPKSADRAAERKRKATVFTRLTGPTLDVTGRTFVLSDSSAFQTCSVSCFPDAHVKENSTGLAERLHPPHPPTCRVTSAVLKASLSESFHRRYVQFNAASLLQLCSGSSSCSCVMRFLLCFLNPQSLLILWSARLLFVSHTSACLGSARLGSQGQRSLIVFKFALTRWTTGRRRWGRTHSDKKNNKKQKQNSERLTRKNKVFVVGT